MKVYQIVIFIGLMFFVSCIKKEQDATQRLFNKYNGKPDIYLFDVPPNLITVFIQENTEKDRQLKAALKTLNSIKILMFKTYNVKVERKDVLFNEINEFYDKCKFEDLTIINKYNERITIKYFEYNESKKELVILFTDKNSFVNLSLSGNFDFQTLTTLLKFENIETLKALKDK